MNITETMRSIYWLFEKHMPKLEADGGAISGNAARMVAKERAAPFIVTSSVAIEAIRKYNSGQSIKSIAKDFGTNDTTIGNVIRRNRAYKNMPHTEKEIVQFFNKMGRA